ncbi:hypothetical protein [Rouxiella badensis]|uniref:hypothetical protein n=1 Tax=Rouxiella badensis TaxID=1646377 RepID=UPI0030764EB5
MCRGSLKPDLSTPQFLVVIMVVLTENKFTFSLFNSQLLAKAIPVRGAIFMFSCIFASLYLI